MKKHSNNIKTAVDDQIVDETSEVVVDQTNNDVELWKGKYLRALADYQNLERRTESQTADIYKRANKKIVLKLLDIVDVLDQAEIFVKDAGLKLVKDEFEKLLVSEGVERMDLVGTPYDPYTAEVIEVVEGDKPETVSEIVKNGYMLHGEVLRVAQVKVTK